DDDDDETPEENLPEVFTDVTLIFTAMDGTVITASAQDPDGEGISDLVVNDPITLATNTTYTLTYEILNALVTPAEDIGAEILDEDDEHQIFFSFTPDAFTSPTGDGNIGASNAADPINYNDTDDNGANVGLNTTWTTGGVLAGGSFRVNLQHQPGVKTATSTSEDGDTDFDLTFVLNIQ
ncbi:MAG: GTP cyclohydrolase, partial [Bacteroidota bacterium]